ncbi:29756_t:CDS:2, partial [Racocetra persica]
ILMNTSRNPRSNRQKGLPAIPFQYHEAYDDRYRTAGRDTYIVNDEYIDNDNDQSEVPSIPERDTYINTDEQISTSPNNNSEKPLPQFDDQSQQKRKNYFNLGKTLTSRFKFKKPNAKDNQDRSVSEPISINEKSQSLLSSLPTLAPSSPISHQLPAEYFPDSFDKDEETKSVEQTTHELTIDDLYHFVLNIRKGFQSQFDEMNSQIKELKNEIRRLKGEESEDEAPKEDVKEDSVTNNATNVRTVTKQMERYGDSIYLL